MIWWTRQKTDRGGRLGECVSIHLFAPLKSFALSICEITYERKNVFACGFSKRGGRKKRIGK